MNNKINSHLKISFALWVLIGLLGGLALGGLMGFSGRELVFPAVVGIVITGMFGYNRMLGAAAVDDNEDYFEEEDIKENNPESKFQKESVKDKTTVSSDMPLKRQGSIDGVIVAPLKTFPDDRGYFREMFRLIDSPLQEAAQVSATMSYPGVVKAFHYHNKQDDLWYCANGMIQAVMYDKRPNSRTYGVTQVVPLGDFAPQTLFIPRGVVHGYKVLGQEPALVIYATTQVYDPDDELRIPHDDPEIGFDWEVKAR